MVMTDKNMAFNTRKEKKKKGLQQWMRPVWSKRYTERRGEKKNLEKQKSYPIKFYAAHAVKASIFCSP